MRKAACLGLVLATTLSVYAQDKPQNTMDLVLFSGISSTNLPAQPALPAPTSFTRKIYRTADDSQSLTLVSATEIEYFLKGQLRAGHYQRDGENLRVVVPSGVWPSHPQSEGTITSEETITFKPCAQGLMDEKGAVLLSQEYYDKAPKPAAPPGDWHKRLLVLAKRLVEVQQATPDDNVNSIIKQNQLDNVYALGDLDDTMSKAVFIRIAIALYQASTAKPDPVVNGLLKEFQITFTPSKTTSPSGQDNKN